jgi:hypothetical protein
MNYERVSRSLLAGFVCTLVFVARASAQERAKDLLDVNPKNFENPTVIDNKWWPLKPGSRHVYDGFSLEDGEPVRHSIVETVTDLTKVIGDIRTLITLEEDYSEGKLVELEIAFHAQDNEGNVWHLGQLSEVYEDNVLVGGRVWHYDMPKGAKAGIRMWGKPELGATASQGFAPPPFNWTDRGRICKMGEKTNVAAGNFDNVVVVEEWDEETPAGVFQTKYYAPEVGLVRIGFSGPDPEQEEVELIKHDHLDEAGLAKARAKALGVEERAYMYARTKPAERLTLKPTEEKRK